MSCLLGVGAVVSPSAAGTPRGIPGPDALSGAAMFAAAFQRADLDPQTKARVLKALGDTIPLAPRGPGAAAADRSVTPDILKALIPTAAIVASGLDPAKLTPPIPAVYWEEDGNELLVKIAEVRADLRTGAVVVTIPVSCDQTGDAEVTVSFITGTPDRPAGGIATSEDHPRGPAPIVENWAEQLIALAWHTLVIATGSLSHGGGNDRSGRELVTAGFSVTADGLAVTPIGRHTFLASRTTP